MRLMIAPCGPRCPVVLGRQQHHIGAVARPVHGQRRPHGAGAEDGDHGGSFALHPAARQGATGLGSRAEGPWPGTPCPGAILGPWNRGPVGLRVTTQPYPLRDADRGLTDLAHDRVTGAAVLVV